MEKSFYKDKLYFLKDCLNYLKKNEITNEFIEIVLSELLRVDNINIGDGVVFFDDNLSYYINSNHKINCTSNYLNNDIPRRIYELSKYYNIYDKRNLMNYLKLYIIIHESIHSYQFNNIDLLIESDKDFIKNIFKDYINFITGNDCDKKKLYINNQHNYFIERHADVEAYKTLIDLSDVDNNELIREYLEMFYLSKVHIGYQDNRFGSIYETYLKTNRIDDFNKIYSDNNLSLEDKIRYGLILDDDEYNLYWDMVEDIEKKNSKVLRI